MLMVTAVVPVFVRVTCCGALEAPTVVAGNVRLVGERETVPVPEATPVPLMVAYCGEPAALSVTPTSAP